MSIATEAMELIQLVEDEIGHQYLGGAIKWVDDNYDDAWTNAIDRLESCLCNGTPEHKIKLEIQIYKASILSFLKLYREHSADPQVRDLFEQVEMTLGGYNANGDGQL